MEYLDAEEFRSLLQVTFDRDRTFHLFILISFGHALRCSEALGLTVDSIDGNLLIVSALKNGVCRSEPLLASENPLIDERLLAVHANGVRMLGQKRLFPWSRATADRRMKELCLLAGIPKAKAHLHALRHGAAMMVFQRTLSLGCIKQLLRHRSWGASLIYLSELDSKKGFEALRSGLSEMAAKHA